MASFMQLANAKLQKKEYNDRVRLQANVDTFVESGELTVDQSRTIIENNFTNNPKSLVVVPNIGSITLAVGQTIQLAAFIYRGTNSGFNITPDCFGQDVTESAQWLKTPSNSTVATISRGLVTGALAGSVEVYAKVGEFESAKITITVA